MKLRQKHAILAAVSLAAVFASGAANAQSYERHAPPPNAYAGQGSVDPCRRTAGNRALGWGIVGLLAGGAAGSAVAAAGVAAEGAALGGLVGAIIGAKAGHASAGCEAYGYWNHPAYRSYQAEQSNYEPDYGYRSDDRDDRRYEDRYDDHRDSGYERAPATYYERRVSPTSTYEYSSSYSSSRSYVVDGSRNAYSSRTSCCEDSRRDSDYRDDDRGYSSHDAYERRPMREHEDYAPSHGGY